MIAPAVLETDSLHRLRLGVVESQGRRLLTLPLVDGYAAHHNNAYALAVYEPDRDQPTVAGRSAPGDLLISYQRLVLVGWMLHLPWAKNPVSLNRSGKRGGWRADAASARTVRDLAYTLALHRIPNQPRIRVSLEWHVDTKRTRDEDNLMKAQKHLVDGLRLAGVIHDDDRTYVLRDMPEIIYRAKADGGYAHMRLFIWTLARASV